MRTWHAALPTSLEGVWHVEPRGAYRLGSPASRHLRITRPWIGEARGGHGRFISGWLDAWFAITLPSSGHAGPSSARPSSLLLTSEDDLLLLSPDDGFVDRVLSKGRYGAPYRALRSQYGAHLPLLDASWRDDDRIERTPYLDGMPLSDLAADAWDATAARLFEGWTSLARASAGQTTEDGQWTAASVQARLAQVSWSQDSQSLLEGDVARTLLEAPGIVPSHGDSHALNVIVVDETPWLIDVCPVRLQSRPWWFDGARFLSSIPEMVASLDQLPRFRAALHGWWEAGTASPWNVGSPAWERDVLRALHAVSVITFNVMEPDDVAWRRASVRRGVVQRTQLP